MFHSAGYFRGVSCPFFEHGLCHRPHCHYRHARSSSKARARKPPQLKTRRVGPSHSEQPRVQPGAAPLQGSGEETASEKGATEGPAKESGAEGGAEGGAGKETVGGVVNFYGSSSEATLPPAEASCDPPGVVQHAEETVLTSAIAPHVLQTPLYAPEKCLARESAYSGELSSPVTLGSNVEIFEDLELPSRSASPEAPREPLPLLAEHELGQPTITEQEIFGSSDELSSDGDVDGEGEGEGVCEGASAGEGAGAAEVKPAVPVNPEELARIEEEFVRATDLLSASAGELQTESRKRKTADPASLSTSAKKQRVAHEKASMASALVQTALQSKPKATSKFAAALDVDAIYMGKKRLASTESGVAVKRPRLSLTVNAKIPTSLRQKFLDSFIDERLKMTSDPQQAYNKALEEERQLFERSSRRLLYLNLSTIALRKLRAQAQQLTAEQRERSDARVRAQQEGGGAQQEGGGAQQEGGGAPIGHTSQDVASKKSEKTVDSGKGRSSKLHDSKKGERRKAASLEGAVRLEGADFASTVSHTECDGGGVAFPVGRGLSDSRGEESHAEHNALFGSSHFYSQSGEVPAAQRRSKGKAPMKAGKPVSKGLKEKRKRRKTSSEASHGGEVELPRSRGREEELPRTRGGEEGLPRTRGGEEELPRTRGREEELPRSGGREEGLLRIKSRSSSDLVADLFGSSDSDDAAVSSPGVAVSGPGSSSEDENAGMSFESVLGSMDDKVVRGRRPTRFKVRKRIERTKGGRRCGRSATSLGSGQESVKTVSENRPGHTPSLDTPPGPSQPDRAGRVSAPSAELARSVHRLRGSDRVGGGAVRGSDRGAVEAASSVAKPTDRASISSLESEHAGSPVDPASLHLPAGPFINLTKVALAHPRGKPPLATTRGKPPLPAGPSLPATREEKASQGRKKKTSYKKVSQPADPAPKPTFTIFKKKDLVLTSTLFHSHLRKYLLTEEQLVENGYPCPTEQGGVASINRAGETPPDIQPVGPNAMRHRCCRCNKPFIIYNSGQYQTVEECVYHFGKLVKMREYGEGVVSKYTCCQERRDSSGCQVAKMHVTSGARPLRDSGYVCTPPPPSPSPQPVAYALDCEMCYTTAGLQLTRVSVVDMALRPVFESLVRPRHPIVDYNTRFSGLTAEDFVSVETTLEEVQQQLLRLFHGDTILLGHSLESDLRALKLIHSSVVDTAIVFPHRKGPPYKRALRTLMVEYVHKFIQDSVDGGHDSLEDSRACMELMLWKVKADLQKTTRRVSND